MYAAGFVGAILLGITLFFLLWNREPETDPNPSHPEQIRKNDDTETETGDPDREEQTNSNDSKSSGASDPEEGEPETGSVMVTVEDREGEPISAIPVSLFSPFETTLAGGEQILSGESGEEGRLLWEDIPVGDGYRVAMDDHAWKLSNFPERSFDPAPGEDLNREEIKTTYHHRGYFYPDLVSGTISVSPGETTEVRLAFDTSSGLHGTVLKPDGSPVEGAAVRITSFVREPRSKLTGIHAKTATSADGKFTVLGLPDNPEGTLQLNVVWKNEDDHYFHENQEIAPPGNTYYETTIRLGAGRTVRIQTEFSGSASTSFLEEYREMESPPDLRARPVIRFLPGDDISYHPYHFPIIDVNHIDTMKITGLPPGYLSVDLNMKTSDLEKHFTEFQFETAEAEGSLYEDNPLTGKIVVTRPTSVRVHVRSLFSPEAPIVVQLHDGEKMQEVGTIESGAFDRAQKEVTLETDLETLEEDEVTLFAHSNYEHTSENIYIEKSVEIPDEGGLRPFHLQLYEGTGAILEGTLKDREGNPLGGEGIGVSIADTTILLGRAVPDENGQVVIKGLPPNQTLLLSTSEFIDGTFYDAEKRVRTGPAGTTNSFTIEKDNWNE